MVDDIPSIGRIVRVDPAASSGATGELNPHSVSWLRAYPNPTGGSVTLDFMVPERAAISLKVFDALGSKIATTVLGERGAGRYKEPWETDGLPNGIYFCELRAGTTIYMVPVIVAR